MRRLKVICAYDGTAYQGWQRQSQARSIQEVLETMLSKLHQHPLSITASGRTDAGVHALGQVFHFDTDKDLDEYHWQAAMNSMLPKDIRIQKVEFVADDFHARFSASAKRYDYLVTDQVDHPFYQNTMALERKSLDVSYMQKCAEIFVGTHDFTSFTSAKIDPRKSRVKTITQCSVVPEPYGVRMIFIGNGFLRYMVRMIAQTLIEAGKHNITKEEIIAMLESRDKLACRYKGAPQGLYLMDVFYGGEV